LNSRHQIKFHAWFEHVPRVSCLNGGSDYVRIGVEGEDMGGIMALHTRACLQPIAVKNVLVVDPGSEIRALLSSILQPQVCTIHYAPDNHVALAFARAKAFDLILTGEKTSGREDVELLAQIRHARSHTRLIILTAESTPADVIAAMRKHAFSYFCKPFSMDSLAEMIRMAMEEPCWDDGIELISATPEWIRLRARCDLKTADRLMQFLNEVAELPDPERSQVATAFREMLLNAIEHGAGLDPSKDVDIEYVRARRMVTCHITDPGPGFTLDEIPHAAIANPDHDPIRHLTIREEKGIRPGGFGVLMAQQLVDQVIYGQDGNKVLLVKYLLSAHTKSA
jgi:CheY-like chemotaxis protein/anti-sigma regulatory factor (Ser/Thr protein kinase)